MQDSRTLPAESRKLRLCPPFIGNGVFHVVAIQENYPWGVAFCPSFSITTNRGVLSLASDPFPSGGQRVSLHVRNTS